jgi:hypothetical protein
MSGLWDAFVGNEGRGVDKWTHCFPAYERHFSRYVGRPVVMVEIGVGEGGSLQLWKGYFGPSARIVGLDILDKSGFEGDQIAIRVGDQADYSVLQGLLDEFGPPDIILDDGSHVMSDIEASFRFLYPRMAHDGVYVVEDLHTAYWPEFGGGLRAPGTFVETAKDLIDALNTATAFGPALDKRFPPYNQTDRSPPSDFATMTTSIHFYDSMIVFERGQLPKRSMQTGGGLTGSTNPT